ncbi:MAG: glutamine--fructose-6-phosphate transaminase (isomerizing) [Clostridiales bacterium]|nr:glutamine--fructose-6-phosphate transaminase (isomerizing) [Clostridiales bacterium]
MCGIIGYIGRKQAAPIMLDGLKRLEYRGYDSSGMAVVGNDGISACKSEGKISVLDKKTDGGKTLLGVCGIGHTRWATHGAPSDKNSHPHLSDDGRFAIVHNGIIENHAEIKARLIGLGYKFKSETDSETIAQLLQYLYKGDMKTALIELIKQIEGSYAIGIVYAGTPDTLYAVRKDSPIVIGLGDGENYVASDVAAALSHTHEFVLLENGEIAEATATSVKYYNANGKQITKKPYTVDWDIERAEKGGYPHFMLKEIFDQPKALTDTVRPRVHGNEIDLDGIVFEHGYLDSLTGIDIVGCGSAYHAGIVGKHFIEKHCRIRVNCTLASEYIYSNPITDGKRLTIIISQSGETADTLAALRLAKQLGSRTLAVVNVVQSAIAREADDVLYTHAGPEIAVATTKGYTTQVAALYLIGLKMASVRGTISGGSYKKLLSSLTALPDKAAEQLTETYIGNIKTYADAFSKQHCVFFIGRGADYAAALEGALKLKEISYVHAEAYAAGELKHGTISLIEQGTLTVALLTQKELYAKTESNVRSVSSRNGTVLAVASKSNSKIRTCVDGLIFIPDCDDDLSPLLTAIVLQIFAYYIALNRGCDIDQPRNLAKSVTVE